MRILITGGAGFIGSHLVEALLAKNNEIVVLDNLSSGQINNIKQYFGVPSFRFFEGDVKRYHEWNTLFEGVGLVYHLAANPEVRLGEVDPEIHFDENLLATFRLLEAMRKSHAKIIVFSSTSTVYGEASVQPTPEEYGPHMPISTYGATKLGSEALVSSYCYTFNLRGLILRLGNTVGSRARHGVVPDFISKLRSSPNALEILGDGNQRKSYVHISDCVEAMLLLTDRFLSSSKRFDIYNVSSPDQVTVRRIAEIVVEEMDRRGTRLEFTGGVEGGRGWPGDVKTMYLSIEKLADLGWKPRYTSEEAIRLATRELLAEAKLSRR
mgnify:CR=1 FL=1